MSEEEDIADIDDEDDLLAEDREVVLRAGTFRLKTPLRLGPTDSGLTLRAANGERVTISGGVEVAGWRQSARAGIWAAPFFGAFAGLRFFLIGLLGQVCLSHFGTSAFFSASVLTEWMIGCCWLRGTTAAGGSLHGVHRGWAGLPRLDRLPPRRRLPRLRFPVLVG